MSDTAAHRANAALLGPDDPCPCCGRYLNRRLAVDALVVRNGELLLIERRLEPYLGLWALPGGGVDFDETAEQAVAREVREETGLGVVEARLFNVYSRPERDPRQAITLVYEVETRGTPRAGSDAASCRFVPLDAVPAVMAFDHGRIVADYRLRRIT